MSGSSPEHDVTPTLARLIRERFGDPPEGLDPETGSGVPADGALATLLAHRTHRRYLRKPVDDRLLDLLLAAALSAPSKSDLQQVCVVVVRDPEKHRAIAGLLPGMPWVADAPRLLVFCGDNRRIRRIAELRGKPFPNDNVDQFMNAAVDAGIVLQAFIVAAQAAGLGCCPLSEIRSSIDTVTQLLELPPNVFPLAGMTLGWPAGAGHVSMRLPPSVTVHQDRYDDSRLPEQIDAYDRRRDARHRIPPEKHRERERWGETDFYGWPEDKARQYARPHRADFLDYLRRRGFAMK